MVRILFAPAASHTKLIIMTGLSIGTSTRSGRFALVKPVNPDDPAVADVIADWKQTPGTVGIRVILTKEANRAGRPRPRPDPTRGGSPRFSGQHPVLGQPRRGHGADRPSPRHAFRHRSYGHPAAERAACAGGALGRPAEGAGAGQTQERGDQGQRRLHAIQAALSFPGHLGPAGPPVRRLGFRAVPVGTDWTRAFAVVNYEQAVEPFLNRMRKNAVLATRFVEFLFETRAVVAENRVLSRLLC